MFNKKLVAIISLLAAITGITGYFVLSDNEDKPTSSIAAEEQEIPIPHKEYKQQHLAKHIVQDTPVKKVDLYNTTDKKMPLSAISNTADVSDNAKETINNILENSTNGFYLLKCINDKIIAITDEALENSTIKRHSFNFIEISSFDGTILNHENIEPDSKYDKWEYKNGLPVKHTHYNEKKELEFTEIWNYSEEETTKYKKINKNNQIISLRKEVIENNINLREENLFYDSEGNMVQNVSFNYDGLDLTRFNYYNSQNPDESAIIVNEFKDGVKQKEILYSTNYQIEKIYIPEYKEGQKSEIKILDKDNVIIEKLVDL